MTGLICDFCSGENPTWTFHAEPFALENSAVAVDEQGIPVSVAELPLWATGSEWAACEACAVLVEAHKKEELLQRCVKTFDEVHGPPPENLREGMVGALRDMHSVFFSLLKPGKDPIRT